MLQSMEAMRSQLGAIGLGDEEAAPPEPVLPSFDLRGVAELLRSGKAKDVVVMVGAGISVNAGIPDFRTKGSGLYDNLQKYDLPAPEAIFELDYFRKKPEPFYHLAREMWPDGRHLPTLSHYFIALLHEKGLLRRCFSQNIDSLERLAGLPEDKLVAAHGNFDGAHCTDCKAPHDVAEMHAAVLSGELLRCARCQKRGNRGLVKPGIVFFGEDLPDRYHELSESDLPACDLLIVMGTSLVVFPFAGLIGRCGTMCPRLLVNRDRAAEMSAAMFESGARRNGFWWGEGNLRDALYQGDCDDGVLELCQELGWDGDLLRLRKEGTRRAEALRARGGASVGGSPGAGVGGAESDSGAKGARGGGAAGKKKKQKGR